MKLHSLDLTDLDLPSYQPALVISGKKKINFGLRTMVEAGGRQMAGLRRGRSWGWTLELYAGSLQERWRLALTARHL